MDTANEAKVGWKFWVGLILSMAAAMVLSFFVVTTLLGQRAAPDPLVEGDMRPHITRLGQVDAVVISRKGCPACAKAKEWASQTNRSLVFVEVDDSPEARDIMRTLKAGGVPTLLVANASFTGFDEARWEELLAR